MGQGPGDESARLQVPLGKSPTAGKLVGARVSGVFTGSLSSLAHSAAPWGLAQRGPKAQAHTDGHRLTRPC